MMTGRVNYSKLTFESNIRSVGPSNLIFLLLLIYTSANIAAIANNRIREAYDNGIND